MSLRMHFLSGLPRSGSTLLAALLRQNPQFHAGISGPIGDLFGQLIRGMSGAHEGSTLISDQQRKRILLALFTAYYEDLADRRLIFDNSRAWCSFLPALAELFPHSRVICCVRSPAWIVDSVERHVQRNPLQPSKIFNYEPFSSVYTRAELLVAKTGFVGASLNGLRQAWFGEHASRLIAVRYNSLTERPADTMRLLYEILGEPSFDHDFARVEYSEPQFDNYLGLPGFHRISGPVVVNKRETILPPDLFAQHDRPFWDNPAQNLRGVTII